jgi:hypothetical protein
MAQHDYDIANGTGAAVRADLNNVLDAIVSNNSGTTSPGTTFAFQWWADTTANQLKIRNSANDAWITLRELDGTLLIEDGAVGTPGLAFADDTDSGFYSSAADTINIATNGVERAEFGTGAIVFNEDGASFDFRVEGDTNANLFFVDGSADSIGIGTNEPGTLLEMHGTAPYITIRNTTEEDTDGGRESKLVFEGEQSGGEISTLAEIEAHHDGAVDDQNGQLVFRVNDGDDGASPTARMVLDSSGQLGIGTTAPGTQVEVDGATPYITLKNNTHEDTDGGRESRIIFEGEQSGGEISTLAQIQASHDGTADDEAGDLIFSVNDGSDGAAPTERLRIHSNGRSEVSAAFSGIQTLTDGATITPDFATGNFFTVTLDGNRTLANPDNMVAGQGGCFFIVQDGTTGGRTLAYGDQYDFAGGTAPTLSTATGAVDRIDYVVRTTGSIHCVFTANYS